MKILLKTLALTFSLLLSSAAMAAGSVEATGKVFYKKPSGEIVQREMSLEVPSRGQGQVVLKWESGSLVADSFSSRQESGRTIFYVLFRNVPFAPAGTEMAFKGTYSRGTNVALYYGDLFSRLSGTDNAAWNYVGGFDFRAPIQQ
jgi:hypothetical protein